MLFTKHDHDNLAQRLKRLVFVVIGIGLLIAAVMTLQASRAFVASSARAPGIVLPEQPYGPAHPRIRFTTATGEIVTYGQNGEVWYHPGDRVTVLYDPAAPQQNACVDTFMALYFGELAIGLMGVVFLSMLVVPLGE